MGRDCRRGEREQFRFGNGGCGAGEMVIWPHFFVCAHSKGVTWGGNVTCPYTEVRLIVRGRKIFIVRDAVFAGSETEFCLWPCGGRGEKPPLAGEQGSEAIASSKFRASLRYRSRLYPWRKCLQAARYLARGRARHAGPLPNDGLAEMRRQRASFLERRGRRRLAWRRASARRCCARQ
jgi:hypothetical protein